MGIFVGRTEIFRGLLGIVVIWSTALGAGTKVNVDVTVVYRKGGVFIEAKAEEVGVSIRDEGLNDENAKKTSYGLRIGILLLICYGIDVKSGKGVCP